VRDNATGVWAERADIFDARGGFDGAGERER
jgi:hypothetical protein